MGYANTALIAVETWVNVLRGHSAFSQIRRRTRQDAGRFEPCSVTGPDDGSRSEWGLWV
jgi:hypothetical protein